MILIIDTTRRDCEVVTFDGRKIQRRQWQWQKDTGTEIIQNIQKLIKSQKGLKDLKAIVVNQGPGSFTGTRVGIIVASALGWSSKIPVLGYSGQKPEEISQEIFRKVKNRRIPHDHYPTPRY